MKHIVTFSGGVDSQTVALIIRRHYRPEDIILLHSRAGQNESELTDNWVKQYSEKVFPVTEVRPLIRDIWPDSDGKPWRERDLDPDAELDFVGLAKIKGRFPSKRAQFCTEALKINPQRRWVWANVKDEYEIYCGVRCDEPNRANAELRYWDKFFDSWISNPILDWKKQWCFDFLKEAGETVNPLYSLGFNRVGCNKNGCVNGKSKDAILLNWDRFGVEWRDRVHAWETETGWTYYPPMVPGMAMNFIDDVIRWAQTNRGGREANMFKILGERDACESKYGLCE